MDEQNEASRATLVRHEYTRSYQFESHHLLWISLWVCLLSLGIANHGQTTITIEDGRECIQIPE